MAVNNIFLHAAKYNLHLAFFNRAHAARGAAVHRDELMRHEAPQRTATDSCGAKRRSAPRRTDAARSAAAAAGASEVRVSAAIELRQGSGGAAPGKFLGDFTL